MKNCIKFAFLSIILLSAQFVHAQYDSKKTLRSYTIKDPKGILTVAITFQKKEQHYVKIKYVKKDGTSNTEFYNSDSTFTVSSDDIKKIRVLHKCDRKIGYYREFIKIKEDNLPKGIKKVIRSGLSSSSGGVTTTSTTISST